MSHETTVPATPREKPVEPVGQRGQGKNGRTEHLVAHTQDTPSVEAGQQDHDQQRDEEDAPERQRIGQIHVFVILWHSPAVGATGAAGAMRR